MSARTVLSEYMVIDCPVELQAQALSWPYPPGKDLDAVLPRNLEVVRSPSDIAELAGHTVQDKPAFPDGNYSSNSSIVWR